MPETVRFANFEFDPVHGLLVTRNGSENPVETRLPPQPASLLALLLEKQPEIVSRDEIRDLLWPDVQVDFDRSLHFCIRQIRSALGESATEPRFIETIPRRGYRWISPPESKLPAPETQTGARPSVNIPAEKEPGDSVTTARRFLPAISFALLAATLMAVLFFFRGNGQEKISPMTPSLRVAIMPFLPQSATSGPFANNSIATDLLALLSRQTSPRMEVIGPTTTAAFSDSFDRIQSLVEEYSIDLVINGRFVDNNGRQRMLAEIIRAQDGAHVWVRYFDSEPGDPIAAVIVAGLLNAIENPPPQRQTEN